MFFVAANAGAKVTPTLRLRVLPVPEAADPARLMLHCAFDNTVPEPRTAPFPNAVPASFIIASVLFTGLYCTSQPAALFRVLLISTLVAVSALTPAGSENPNWNVWVRPLPVLGVADTAAGAAVGTFQVPRVC